MTFYVTKHALTAGIQKYEESDCRLSEGGYLYPNKSYVGISPKNFHKSKEEAISAAESMRLAKIASLKKQIAKLEKLDFNVKEKS